MERITTSRLDGLCKTLNTMTDSPLTAWTKGDDGRLSGNVGHWMIDHNACGYTLQRVSNDGGGVSTSIGISGTARDVYDQMHAMLNTIYAIKRGDSKIG